jgi:hypothetical protein
VVDNGDMSVAIGDMTITERLYKSVILRVVGADLTMGLVMIDKRPLTTLTYMAAIEPHDPRFSEIISDAFLVDLSQHPGEGRATGLFGFWAVSGHWWALFGASMFFGAIAIAAERLFLPFSNIGLSAGVAFQSVILIWEFSFDMMPLFVIALFAVYIVLRYFYYKGNPMATDPQIPLYR